MIHHETIERVLAEKIACLERVIATLEDQFDASRHECENFVAYIEELENLIKLMESELKVAKDQGANPELVEEAILRLIKEGVLVRCS